MNRTILCIAFHFPPIAVSSGMQRSLKFVRYLRDDGWEPVVLTVSPRAYARRNESQLAEIPSDVPVYRAFGLDATRDLAIAGRYPGFLTLPDPWLSWLLGAVPVGLKVLRRHRPALIWSTFPIATASLVGLVLQRFSGLPWIADLRDPMTMDDYPADPRRRRAVRWIEQRVMNRASRCVFTARRTLDMYTERYPALAGRTALIPNGFDEANFPSRPESRATAPGEPLRLVHSGGMPQDGRSPGALFEAVARLLRAGVIERGSLEIILRGCGPVEEYRALAAAAGIPDMVRLEPHLPYEQAIEEMVSAGGLLIFQGTVYNHAVPAKLYEYLYARRPIFALVDRQGETANVLRELAIDSMADIDDPADIAAALERFMERVRSGEARVPGPDEIAPYSRRRQAQQLSALAAEVLAEASGPADAGVGAPAGRRPPG